MSDPYLGYNGGLAIDRSGGRLFFNDGQGPWRRLLDETNDGGAAWKTLESAGAVGDGTTDSSQGLATAFAQAGKWDGLGKTYRAVSPITDVASGFELDNAVLDFRNCVTTDTLVKVVGTQGTPIALTANTTRTSSPNVVTVGSTAALAVEGYAWLAAETVWNSANGSIVGQVVQIKSIDSGTAVSLYEDVELDFYVSDNATLTPITPKRGVKFGKSVKIIGPAAYTQIGIKLELGLDCEILAATEDIDYTHIGLWRSINTKVVLNARRARVSGDGTSYGLGIWAGCYGTRVYSGYAEDMRHAVTIGDDEGINLFTNIFGNVFRGMRSAGIDSHDSSKHTTIVGNQIALSATAASEGINMQGLNAIIAHNRITGCDNVGIYIHPSCSLEDYAGSAKVLGNEIWMASNTAQPTVSYITVTSATAAGDCLDLSSIEISDNTFHNGIAGVTHYGIYVLMARAGAILRSLKIDGNIWEEALPGHALFLRTQGIGAEIRDIVLNGNTLRTTGTRAVRLLGDGGGSSMDTVSGQGNILDGGSTSSWSFEGVISNVALGINTYKNVTKRVAYTSDLVSAYFEDLNRADAQTITNATATLDSLTNWVICNRAGTITLTLPAAAKFAGRTLTICTLQAQTVVSAASDVIPITGGAAGTAILGATAGAFATLQSNGTNWVIKTRG